MTNLILSNSHSHYISLNSDPIVFLDNYHPSLSICNTQLRTPPYLHYPTTGLLVIIMTF